MTKRSKKPKPPFPPRFTKAFELLCQGVPKPVIAQVTGYSMRSIYRNLAKPEVKQLMVQIAKETVAEAAPRAALKLTELMAQTDSKKVSLEAVQHILGTAGIRPAPASSVVNLNFVPPMPSRGTITDNMSDDEVREIEAEWAAYARAGGVGYLVCLRDRYEQIPVRKAIEAKPVEGQTE